MKRLLDWFDDRTGVRQLLHEALYERIPGGSRWRYVWGSTLVFVFVTQVVTGIFLWMGYSPSSQTAWESVYFIQHEMTSGWLLRGIHHFMSQAMIVLMALHLMQVVIDGAYRAPREMNFWTGLFLMLLVLGLSLTGYLLPWDQKGYWATNVATNLMTLVPVLGEDLQLLVVGGSSYGHHTLTRFFAVHAGLLPGLLVLLLVVHLALFRRSGITTRPSSRPLAYFWPEQVLKDAVACLAVLAVVLLLCLRGAWSAENRGLPPGDYLGAHLGAPADPSEQYSAARPEWYFLFLFQLLKYFHSEFFGAIVLPGLVLAVLFLMPLVGRWQMGHRFNVAFVLILICAAVGLTAQSLRDDYYARWHADVQQAGAEPDPRVAASRDYLAAVEQAERDAHRVRELIRRAGGIPVEGAVTLLRSDPETQGPRLFARHCQSCHSHVDPEGQGLAAAEVSAPNLYAFASRAWIAGMLDPEKIVSDHYFGQTVHVDGDMVAYVEDQVADLDDDGRAELQSAVAALSAEAGLACQRDADDEARADGTLEAGAAAIVDTFACTDCHKFHDEGELGSAPDLTGYGSEEWLIGMISNPNHERFYESKNDRMPAFAEFPKQPQKNLLSEGEVRMLARWLRGDDHTPIHAVPSPLAAESP